MEPPDAVAIRFGDWLVKPSLNQLCRDGEVRQLQPKSMDILLVLLERPGAIVSQDELLESVWSGRYVELSALHRKIMQIRKALGDDARRPRYLETVAKRGYRIIAPVSGRSLPATSVEQSSRLAILPFEDLSGGNRPDLVKGLVLDIGSRLANVADFTIISHLAVDKELAGGVDDTGGVAERLHADHVLQGSLRMAGQRVRISVQLSHIASSELVWSGTFDRDLTDLFALQSEVALAVAHTLKAAVTDAERVGVESRATDDVVAFQLLQRARTRPTENSSMTYADWLDVASAITRQAIELDPRYADAWAQAAWLEKWRFQLGRTGSLDEARALAEKSVTLDDRCATGHYARGTILALDGRLRSALHEFRRAADIDHTVDGLLNDLSIHAWRTAHTVEALEAAIKAVNVRPNDGNTRWHLSLPLARLDQERAARWLQRARAELPNDPGTARVDYALGWVALRRGDVDEVRLRAAQLDRAGREHGWVEGHIVGANLYLALGDWQAARAILAFRHPGPLDRDLGGFPSVRTGYALALQKTGVNDQFEGLYDASLEEATRRIEAGHENPSLRVELAAIHAVRGDVELAAEWLDRSYDLGHRDPRVLDHPMFEGVRDDVRCQRVAKRIVEDLDRARANAERDGLIDAVDRMLAADAR